MPHAPFVVPPLLQILILTVSAVAKLRDPRDAAAVFARLGLPRFVTTLKGPLLLPYGELAVAALLLFLPGHAYVVGATLSLLLFVAYFAVVARALRFPYPLLCGCFGKLGLGWITRHTLIRNGVLVALALITWVDSWRGDGVAQRLHDLGSSWWWVAGVIVAVVVTALVVREGPPPPYVTGEGLDGEAYDAVPVPYVVLDGPDGPGSVWRLTDVSARLLVFWHPDDHRYTTLPDRLESWQESLAPVRVHLVVQQEWSAAHAHHPEVAGSMLLGDPDGETQRRLGVHRLPGAVLLGADRLLAGGPAEGMSEIEELVEAATEEIRNARDDAAALEAKIAASTQGVSQSQ